jgi:hypothetical protein
MSFEAAQKVEPTHGGDAGEIVQGQIVLEVTVDAIDRAGDLRLRRTGVARCGGTGGVVARQ